jgi:hypothetical protein
LKKIAPSSKKRIILMQDISSQHLSMDFSEFKLSLKKEVCPQGLNIYARALWLEGRGQWEQSHELIQDLTDRNAALIHAYLHRKEGDQWNANYWYSRAQAKPCQFSLQEEWDELAKEFITK